MRSAHAAECSVASRKFRRAVDVAAACFRFLSPILGGPTRYMSLPSFLWRRCGGRTRKCRVHTVRNEHRVARPHLRLHWRLRRLMLLTPTRYWKRRP